MAYDYNSEKPWIFTEEGQRDFLKIRDGVWAMLNTAGAFKMHKALLIVPGDTWKVLACVDRLVELGEIREVTDSKVWGQDRVFVRRNQ